MKKNSDVHVRLDTEFFQKLKKQAEELGITVSVLCRQKLKENTQLTRIEGMVSEINRKIKYSTKYKQEVTKW